jgi:hypothetical protein
MITISMTSTAAARNVVTKTEEWLTATSLGPIAQVIPVKPGTSRPPLQCLGRGDAWVSRIQREFGLAAPACAGRPSLLGDPYLRHIYPSIWFGSCRSVLPRVARERPGVVMASTRTGSRRAAIHGWQLAGMPS